MKEIKVTRDFFLWCMSVVYMSAFTSLYHQIPGLYGDNGILPARAVIPLEADADVVRMKAKEIPTLLWLAPALGIDVPLMMDMLALLGILMSFGCMVWGRMRDMTNFTLLWMLYFSLYQVGQIFMWYQWDRLLLETGFLTILVAPLGFLQHVVRSGPLSSLPHRPHDTVSLWLVRWLLFRLTISSGVFKLTSNCPTYWGLTALNYHFESQYIPSPLAWYAHHIPSWLLKLGVVGNFVAELAIPFLFFIPIRSLRNFSYYVQVIIQIGIMLTGNYSFYNILIITLCISLVDDEFLLGLVGRPMLGAKTTSGAALRYTRVILTKVIEGVVIVGLAYWTTYFFSLKIKPDWTVDSKIAFTSVEFRKAVTNILPATVVIGAVSLGANILLAFYRSFIETGALRKIWGLLGTIFISCAAVWIFLISLVPYTAMDTATQKNLWPILREWQKNVEQYQISNIYGQSQKIKGTEGWRPELIIEGSNSMTAGWKEYHFLHKPGDVAQRPQYLIPHQPRLDWQLASAALSTYEEQPSLTDLKPANPWLVSFIYRLLEGRKEVLELLDKERLPFAANRPPKFVRAVLYKYNYTPLKTNKPSTDWWIRGRVDEYFSSSSLDGNEMVEFLKAAGIPLEKTRYLRVTNHFLKKALTKVRFYAESISATAFIWSILCTGFCVNFLAPVLRFR